jgi:hypothetical protein
LSDERNVSYSSISLVLGDLAAISNMAAADPNGIGKPLFDPSNAKVEYVIQPWDIYDSLLTRTVALSSYTA